MLQEWQEEVLNDNTDVIEVNGGRRIGKTYLAVRLALKYNNSIYFTKTNNMKETFREQFIKGECYFNITCIHQIKLNILIYLIKIIYMEKYILSMNQGIMVLIVYFFPKKMI